jgi:hypothetical protein
MSITVECTCGKKLKAKDEAAGKTGRCPACGNPVNFPVHMPEVGYFEIDLEDAPFDNHLWKHSTKPAELPSPHIAVPPPLSQKVSGQESSPHRLHESEPWYYGFLDKYAGAGQGIGLLAGVLVMGMTLAVANSIHLDSPVGFLAIVFAGFSVAGLMFVSILFGVALILLAVDAGRNLRAIRLSLSSKG